MDRAWHEDLQRKEVVCIEAATMTKVRLLFEVLGVVLAAGSRGEMAMSNEAQYSNYGKSTLEDQLETAQII